MNGLPNTDNYLAIRKYIFFKDRLHIAIENEKFARLLQRPWWMTIDCVPLSVALFKKARLMFAVHYQGGEFVFRKGCFVCLLKIQH